MTQQGTIPLKHCHVCNNDLPATEQYFYRSYLKSNGRDICKNCHRERNKSREKERREILLAHSHLLEGNILPPSYQTITSIAKTIGKEIALVEKDILNSGLSIFRLHYNNMGWSFILRREDALTYIRRCGHATEDIEQKSEPIQEEEPLFIPVPGQCGSCKTIRGTIYSHIDPVTKEYLGGLCIKCKRMVDALGPKQQKDSERVLSVARYLTRIYDADRENS